MSRTTLSVLRADVTRLNTGNSTLNFGVLSFVLFAEPANSGMLMGMLPTLNVINV
jgi:hypothetical protein